MAQTIATSLEKLNTALEGDKTALIEKKVAVPDDTKHSNVPDLIALVKAGVEEGQSGQITVNCSSEYEGAIMTFTNGDVVIKESVSNGKCVVYPKKEGTWTITNNKDDQVLSCVVEFVKNSLTLNWIDVTFVEAGSGDKFKEAINKIDSFNNIVNLRISDEVAPKSVTTYDVSKAGNKSVCLWRDGDTLVVSTQVKKARVSFTEVFYHVYYEGIDEDPDFDEDFSIFSNYSLYETPILPYQNVDLSNADFSKVKNLNNLFLRFGKVAKIDLSQATGLSGGHITELINTFAGCSALTNLSLGDLDTSNVTTMDSMFVSVSCDSANMQTIVNNLNVKSVKNMSSMFSSCKMLTTLNLSKWNTNNLTDMSGMFYNCTGLTTIDLSDFKAGTVTFMGSLFQGCSNLTNIISTTIDTSSVTTMAYMFSGCSSLNNMTFINKLNTRSVVNMAYMFYNTNIKTVFNPPNFNYDKVKFMEYMFYQSAFTEINLSKLYSAECISRLVANCKNLVKIDMSGFNASHITFYSKGLAHYEMAIAACFYNCPLLTTIIAQNWYSQNSKIGREQLFLDSTSLPGYVNNHYTGYYAKPISAGGYFTSP